MATLPRLYRHSLTLLNDLYELTMAYGYWKCGRTQEQAAFHLAFRRAPFGGRYAIACGLEYAMEFLATLRFEDDDLAYLAGLTGADGRPLFEPAFLDYLRAMKWEIDVDAVPEGTVVFPHEPMLRVTGPILQAQIVETALLNMVNFQTLLATKAARVVEAAQGDSVLEFGVRRAQGIDGALAASRAAYVGGCHATSNLLAGKLFGIPVRGTHAHSWVMSFDSEPEAFAAYAEAMPNNAVFLVDTYNTLDGVRHAIEAGRELRRRGHEMLGIRLDSGDFAYLSVKAREMLDAAGFPNASIFASNDLDEHLITSLKSQGAKITSWGVGTSLVTAKDDPALGGVYKLSAIRDNASAPWRPRVKVSEQPAKSSVPGVLQVRRFRDASHFVADMIFDESSVGPPQGAATIVDPNDALRRRDVPGNAAFEDLLVPVFRGGRAVYSPPPLTAVRQRVQQQLASLHPTIRRLVNPHDYPAGLELGLHDLRTRLILQARDHKAAPASPNP